MPSFGLALRGTRERQGISLDDVARDTRLTKRYLLALEDESIHELPGGPYNRAYVRTYAAYLGLDPDGLVRDYELEAEAQTEAGRLAVRPDVLAAMRRAVQRRRSQRAPESLRRIARAWVFASVAVALLVGLAWMGTRRFRPSDETVSIGGTGTSAPVVSTSAGGAVDRNAARPEPPRLEPRTAGVEEVRPPPLGVQTPAAENAARLSVARSGVGTDVVDRQLVGGADTFAVGTRVAFWMLVTGGRPGDTVRHVWVHQGQTVGTVTLSIGTASWRTQSRRTLAPGAEGDWIVEAHDAGGRVLARHAFRCEP